MLRIILLGVTYLAVLNLVHAQEEYPLVHRVEDLPPLEDVYTTYRLPNNTLPNSYDVTLRTWIHDGNFSFTGSVRINISIEVSTNTITLHHRYLTIGEVRLWSATGSIVPVVSHSYNTTFEFFTVTVQETLAPGQTYTLDIDYNGTLRSDDAGFYRSSYVADDGSRRWLATTQFESTDARHSFPCYDEPNKKASFRIRITHDPSYSAISNMPEVSTTENADGSITTEFEETPLMSTYLVAYIVSDFGNLSSSQPRDVPQRTFARPNAVNQSTLMLNAGERIMDALENYFGLNYSLPKMDQAGIPDFSAGAMENWGLVTYRESYFFYNESVTTYVSVLGTVKVIAHEYVHQWFGNLVSPSWWTYLWLNEGFARFVEHIGVNLVYPDWQMIDYFLVRTMHNVFQSDAAINSRPMSLYVEHPNDIDRQFSNIAYDKAGSVIRMFMNVLTEATFVKGLNLYLNEMSFSNAEEGDLFSALNRAAQEDSTTDIDIATAMGSWSQRAGFPVVTVTRSYDEGSAAQNVILSQQRYFTTQPSTPDYSVWWIPINYATAQNPNFDDTTADEWFPPNNQLVNFTFQITSLTGNDWLIINKQETGYYRVLYDEQNYRLLSEALYNNIDLFHNLNRAQLIDDTYNFVRTERLTYNTFLHVARFLEFDHEYASWYPAVTAFTTMDRYFAGHADYPVFREYIRNLIEHLYVMVGIRDQGSEPQMRKYSRTIAINWACNMGSVHCRSDATRELRSLISNNGADFHQNVRDVLYCAALRAGNRNDFDFVWNRLLNSDDATTRNLLLNALGCSTTRQILIEFIRSSLNSTNDGGIDYRSGEALRVFNAVYQNGLTGLEIAVEFLHENIQEAYSTYGSTNFANTLTGMAQRIGNEQLIAQFDLLLVAAQERNLASATIISRAREYVEENSSWLTKHGDVISDWLTENFQLKMK